MGNYIFKTKLRLISPTKIDIYINDKDTIRTLMIYTLNKLGIEYFSYTNSYRNKYNFYITYTNPEIYFNDILQNNNLIIKDVINENDTIKFKIIYNTYEIKNNTNIYEIKNNTNIYIRIKNYIINYIQNNIHGYEYN